MDIFWDCTILHAAQCYGLLSHFKSKQNQLTTACSLQWGEWSRQNRISQTIDQSAGWIIKRNFSAGTAGPSGNILNLWDGASIDTWSTLHQLLAQQSVESQLFLQTHHWGLIDTCIRFGWSRLSLSINCWLSVNQVSIEMLILCWLSVNPNVYWLSIKMSIKYWLRVHQGY